VTPEYDIVRLGAQGDGVAETDKGVRFVPLALPGEHVRLHGDDVPEVVGKPSLQRVTPACGYFGVCGGCAAQHMSEQLYAEWKRGIVVEALRHQGLEAQVAPLRSAGTRSRRRAILTASHEPSGRVRLGYHRRKSNETVDITECPILAPAIAARLPALRAVAEAIPNRTLRLTVLATDGGLDITVGPDVRRLPPAALARLAAIAEQNGLARISLGPEPIVERTAPVVEFGGVRVVPPPGAFLQAAERAEHEICQITLEAVSRAKRVADLFCGIGTWALPLAHRARVLAVDGDKAALDALEAAARKAQGLKPIEVRLRDLFREPLSAQELKGFEAVVFDPPRAGARAQAEKLAGSQVGVVVAISCDPGTLARDLRILVDGGYTISTVTPIDQFVFSAHVEVAAVLRRQR
jgi:23S rRNA (uracil1939-C5)-methyltransferase